MEDLNTLVAQWLAEAGWNESYITLTTKAIIILGILLVAFAVTVVFRRLIVPALQKISARTKATWDDYLFSDRVMHCTARLIPPIIWYALLRAAFYDMPLLLDVLHKGCIIYLIVVFLQLVAAFLDTLYDISSRHETLRNRPLKGVYQMIKLLAVCVGVILIVSILIGRDATTILAGLGASAAIIMLIFRDSILGLVAGVQLSANDMLRPGDWITMTKYGADGYVTEVTLTTVKVQNFDKTITTIPPYALVSDSFQNWRGMWESGGRRIKRSLLIDASTVRALTGEELAALSKKQMVEAGDAAEPVVNLYALREYAARYIKHHPEIHPDLMQMVRALQPTPEGIPIEVYCFTRDTNWVAYEAVQGAVFDHLLAVLPEFGLRCYQRSSDRDADIETDSKQ
ncbi:mechanosensitive ion channel family protein [Alistipes provencensis]|uniref:mechanosensitive ion channel family protein n=1 Tax=Alistipes provencensis TaxID=1816676 RepID=UPI0007EC7F5F|nr:mechanosensitive ion channel domain-containing protein [Alistipes provencensis]